MLLGAEGHQHSLLIQQIFTCPRLWGALSWRLLNAGLMPPVEVEHTNKQNVISHRFVISASLRETSLGLTTSSSWHFMSLR